MKILIIAGGFATRMLLITEQIPKCLIDINGKPLIEHQLLEFRRQGFFDIVFCVAHLADKVKEYFGDGSNLSMNISYVQEAKELMGTAGSVKLTEELLSQDLDEDFIVFYGDNLCSMNFSDLLETHRNNQAFATMVIRPFPAGKVSSSVVEIDQNNEIITFLEKPEESIRESYKEKETWNNNGIYILSKKVLSLIPEGEKYDFAHDLFPKIMEEHLGFYGYPCNGFYREIGRVEKYEKFLEEVKDKKNIFE